MHFHPSPPPPPPKKKDNSCTEVFIFLSIGATLKDKNLLPMEQILSNFFPLRLTLNVQVIPQALLKVKSTLGFVKGYGK